MTPSWLSDVVGVAQAGSVVRAVIVAAKGSTPREVGAGMLIFDDRSEDTIGGGALEHDVMTHARQMLDWSGDAAWMREVRDYHLGPDLNQCCGGAVSVLLERFGAAEYQTLRQLCDRTEQHGVTRPLVAGIALEPGHMQMPVPLVHIRNGQRWFSEPMHDQLMPVVIYGSGHVACALTHALATLPFAVTQVETEPAGWGPQHTVTAAPPGAFHLVMTHSHTLDEAIVAAILRDGRFGYLGLIGSETKKARFRQRLLRDGIAKELVDQMICPIGLSGLPGKAPAIIAASVAADLLVRQSGVARTAAAGPKNRHVAAIDD